jgi:hypothetical protein
MQDRHVSVGSNSVNTLATGSLVRSTVHLFAVVLVRWLGVQIKYLTPSTPMKLQLTNEREVMVPPEDLWGVGASGSGIVGN